MENPEADARAMVLWYTPPKKVVNRKRSYDHVSLAYRKQQTNEHESKKHQRTRSTDNSSHDGFLSRWARPEDNAIKSSPAKMKDSDKSAKFLAKIGVIQKRFIVPQFSNANTKAAKDAYDFASWWVLHGNPLTKAGLLTYEEYLASREITEFEAAEAAAASPKSNLPVRKTIGAKSRMFYGKTYRNARSHSFGSPVVPAKAPSDTSSDASISIGKSQALEAHTDPFQDMMDIEPADPSFQFTFAAPFNPDPTKMEE